jgi:glucuronate isomerase
VLCNLIGRDVDHGEIPDDESLLGPMIRNICYLNAERYLDLNSAGVVLRPENGKATTV